MASGSGRAPDCPLLRRAVGGTIGSGSPRPIRLPRRGAAPAGDPGSTGNRGVGAGSWPSVGRTSAGGVSVVNPGRGSSATVGRWTPPSAGGGADSGADAIGPGRAGVARDDGVGAAGSRRADCTTRATVIVRPGGRTERWALPVVAGGDATAARAEWAGRGRTAGPVSSRRTAESSPGPDSGSGDDSGSDGDPDGRGLGAASGRRCTSGLTPVRTPPDTGVAGRSRSYPRPPGACGLTRCPGAVRKVGSCQVLNRSRNPSGSVRRSCSPTVRRSGGSHRQPGSADPDGSEGSDGAPACPVSTGTAAAERRRSSRSSRPTLGHSPSLIRVLMRAISPT